MPDVLFATNRVILSGGDAQPSFGTTFAVSHLVRFGVAEVALRVGAAATDDDGFVVGKVNAYPAKEPPGSPDVSLPDGLVAELRRRLAPRDRALLVFVHGFANSFDSALQRAAALQRLYAKTADGEAEPVVLAFAWPSQGALRPHFPYVADGRYAAGSGPALAGVLLALRPVLQRADGSPVRLHLLAHSMGNWVLRHAMRTLVETLGPRPRPRPYANALLVAADEDADALHRPDKLAPLFQLAERVQVYHSAGDGALNFSTTNLGNPKRLGRDGPVPLAGLPGNPEVVDCSRVDWTRKEHVRHQYYRIRPEVIDDVKAVLAGTAPHAIPGREPAPLGRWRLRQRARTLAA